MLVALDGYDPMIIESVRAQPPELSPVAAIRAGIGEVMGRTSPEDWDAERERQELIRTVPELRVRQLQQYVKAIGLVAGMIAERAGLPAGDPTVIVTDAVELAVVRRLPGASGEAGAALTGTWDGQAEPVALVRTAVTAG